MSKNLRTASLHQNVLVLIKKSVYYTPWGRLSLLLLLELCKVITVGKTSDYQPGDLNFEPQLGPGLGWALCDYFCRNVGCPQTGSLICWSSFPKWLYIGGLKGAFIIYERGGGDGWKF